jgi:hypothetical protein
VKRRSEKSGARRRACSLVLLSAAVSVACAKKESELTVTQLDEPTQDTAFTLRLPLSAGPSGHWIELPLSRKRKKNLRFSYVLEIEHRNPAFDYFARNSSDEIIEKTDSHLKERYTYLDLFGDANAPKQSEELFRTLSADMTARLTELFHKVTPQNPLLVSVTMKPVQLNDPSRARPSRRRREGRRQTDEKPPGRKKASPGPPALPPPVREAVTSIREPDKPRPSPPASSPATRKTPQPPSAKPSKPPAVKPVPPPVVKPSEPPSGKMPGNPYR